MEYSFLRKVQSEIDSLASNNSNADGEKDVVFFRGQSSDYKLVPSLWRCCNDENIKRIENQLFCDTFITCPDYINSQSSWELLAMMQHFGIPTRLLDWTSSLGNALYFALEECLFCNGSCKICQSKPAIWLLVPHKMHETFYPKTLLASRLSITIGVDSFYEYRDCFLDCSDLIGAIKCCPTKASWNWNNPIFMEIPWRNLRIKSQKGVFTFHSDSKPLEEYKNSNFFLRKIELSKSDIDEAKKIVKLLDISAFDMFSDLPSLAKYLRKKYLLEKLKNEKTQG